MRPSSLAFYRPAAARVVLLTLIAGGLLACPVSVRADVISDWNQIALNTIAATNGAPPPSARTLAMLSTAVYNAANGAGGNVPLYGGMSAGPAGADATAAAAQAARDVLAYAYPALAASFDSALTAQLAAIPDSAAKAAGRTYGSSAASYTIASRASDGASAAASHTPSPLPGRWVPTGALTTPLFQQFAHVTPWAMTATTQFRPPAPPAYGSPAYLAAVAEVRTIGQNTSLTRTPEQSDIALLWAAGGGSVTPPGMWNQIAQQAAAGRGFSIQQTSRMFALLNIALADAAVVSWDAKVFYDTCRPVTACAADDPAWQSFITTPQFQTYTSGHSTFSGAAAEVLAGFFGSDAMNFTATNHDGSITRSFASFSAAAAEAGMSRIYGGIHFNFDNTAGLESGGALGAYVANTMLIPAPGSAAALLVLGALAARRRRRAN